MNGDRLVSLIEHETAESLRWDCNFKQIYLDLYSKCRYNFKRFNGDKKLIPYFVGTVIEKANFSIQSFMNKTVLKTDHGDMRTCSSD